MVHFDMYIVESEKIEDKISLPNIFDKLFDQFDVRDIDFDKLSNNKLYIRIDRAFLSHKGGAIKFLITDEKSVL